jgi:hypothetical protein
MPISKTDRIARKLNHTKQERLQVSSGVPSVNELRAGVPVVRSTPEGVVEYTRHNNALYKKVLDQDVKTPKSIDTSVDAIKKQFIINKFIVERGPELTIASGAITVSHLWHYVDTEGDASSDNLDEILGGIDGQLLILTAENSARTVVVRDDEENIKCGSDFSLTHINDVIVLMYHGDDGEWVCVSTQNNDV